MSNFLLMRVLEDYIMHLTLYVKDSTYLPTIYIESESWICLKRMR